jgi:gas vesicle protein
MNLTPAAQNAFSGAVVGGVAGALYALLTAPKAYREHDLKHYGLLGAAVGGAAYFLLAAPTPPPGVTITGS